MGQGKRSSAKQCSNNGCGGGYAVLVVLGATVRVCVCVCVLGWVDIVMAVHIRGQL